MNSSVVLLWSENPSYKNLEFEFKMFLKYFIFKNLGISLGMGDILGEHFFWGGNICLGVRFWGVTFMG
jgi:hypothetical protein